MKKNLKRWLALLLAITMIVTSGAFTNLTYLRATDSETPEAAASAETQQETKTEEKEKEKKQEVKVEAKDDKAAEEAKKAEEEAKAKAEEQKKAEEAAKAEEQKKAEEAAKADEQKKAEEAAKADEQKAEESATTEEAQKSNEETKAEETVTPAETAQEGQKAEESAKEENKEQTYDITIKEPKKDGGSIRAWVGDAGKVDVSFKDGKYVKEVKEGETFHFEIKTKDGYTVDKVKADKHKIEANVDGNTYTYELKNIKEDRTLDIKYKEEKATDTQTADTEETSAAESQTSETGATEEETSSDDGDVPQQEQQKQEEQVADTELPTDENPTELEQSVVDETQQEIRMPAQKLVATASDGAKVTVNAPEGALPEGTSVNVRVVRSKFVENAVAEAVEGEGKELVGYKAYDITIVGPDGNEIQPENTVKVNIKNADVNGEDATVYHVENGNADKVADVSSTENANFSAEHFSIYVIAGAEAKAVATYEFYDGETKVNTQKVKDGEKLNKPDVPVHDGKYFTGWFVEETNAKVDFDAPVSVATTATVKVVARYEEAYYVYFKNTAGVVVATKQGKNGDAISVDDVSFPLAADKGISGWYTDAALMNRVEGTVTLNGANVTVYPKVEQGHYITYEAEGGTYTKPVFVAPGQKTTAPAEPTRLGYTFKRWSTQQNGAAYTFGNELEKDVTLHAVWEAKTVTYHVIYWKENADYQNTYLSENLRETERYEFASTKEMKGATGQQTAVSGWAGRVPEGFELQAISQQEIKGDGSTIVNVYLNRKVYTVEFYVWKNTGTSWWPNWTYAIDSTKTITAKYEANISSKWPQKENGATNWKVGKNSDTQQVNIDTMPLNGAKFYEPDAASGSEKATYYVEVLPGETGTAVGGKQYKVHHTDVSDGSGYRVTEEDRYPITGFTLNKGISTSTGRGYDGAKFYYTRNKYNVVFNNNGATVKTVEAYYQASLSGTGDYTPTAPAGKEGYTFAGWYTNSLGEGTPFDFDTATMPARNITVYAKWVAPTFTASVHVTLDGSGEVKDITKEAGTKLLESELPPINVPEGSTFRGWYLFENGKRTTAFNFNTEIHENITLVPYWTSDKTHNVTYDANGASGDVPKDDNAYAEGAYAEVLDNTGLTGPDGSPYFTGWKSSVDNKIYYPGDKIEITADITFTAQWSNQLHTSLTYDANNGTGASESYPYLNNETVTLKGKELFAYNNYNFTGWNTKEDGTGTAFKAGAEVIVDNIGTNVLYAQWEKKVGKIGYNLTLSGATINTTGWSKADGYKYTVDNEYYKYPDEFTVTDRLPSCAGFEFLGWFDKAREKDGYSSKPAIREAGKSVTFIYKGADVYTLDALWASIKAEGATYPYDGEAHTIKSAKVAYNSGNLAKEYVKQIEDNHLVSVDEMQYATEEDGKYTPTMPTFKNAGTYDVYCKTTVRVGSTSKTLMTKATVTITPRPVTITAASDEKMYGEADPSFAPAIMSNQVAGELTDISLAVSRSDAGDDTVGKHEGVLSISATKEALEAEYTNYTFTIVPADFTVNTNQNGLTVSASDVKQTYDGTGYGVTAQANKPGAKILYKDANGEYTLTESPKQTDVGSLTVEFKASLYGYGDAYGTATVTIDKRPVTIAAVSAEKTYGEADPSFAPAIMSNQVAGELTDISLAVSRSDAGDDTVGKHEGVLSISATKEALEAEYTNYTFTIVPADFTVTRNEAGLTVSAANVEQTYDGTGYGVNASAGVQGATILYKDANGEYTLTESPKQTDVGSLTVEFKASLYGYADAYGTATVTINKRPVTITAASAEKTYGEADPSFAPAIMSNQVAGELTDISLAVSRSDAGDDTVGKHEGVLSISATKEALEAEYTNYTFTIVPADFTVNTNQNGLTVSASDVKQTYDGTGYGVTAQANKAGAKILYKDANGEYTLTESPKQTDVGNLPVEFKASLYGYADAYGTATVTIDKRPVTITAVSAEKTYGEADPSFAPAIMSNQVAGELTDISLAVSRSDAGDDTVGKHEGVLSISATKEALEAEYTNYTFTIVPADFTVTRNEAGLTVSAANVEQTYDGTGYGVNASAGVQGATILYKDANGEYTLTESPKQTDVGSLTVEFKASLYGYADAYGTATVTINKRPVTITAASAEKTYGEADPSFAPAIMSNQVAGELTDISLAVSRSDAGDDTVGKHEGVLSISATKEALEAEYTNYTFTIVPADFTVNTNQNGLTVSASDVKQTYDGTGYGVTAQANKAGATILYKDANGEYTLTESPKQTDVGNLPVEFKASLYGYADAYGTATVTIDKRPVTIAAVSAEKTYGEADPSFAPATMSNQVAGELTDISLAVSRSDAGDDTVGKHEGVLSISATKEALEAEYTNYTFTIVPADFTVTRNEAGLTVSAANVEQTYDGTGYGVNASAGVQGATILYKDANGEYTLTESPKQTDVGSLTVEFKASLYGYADAYGTATVTINKRPVTITAASAEKTYGEADPSFAPAIMSNQVAGELTDISLAVSRSDAGDDTVGKHEGVLSISATKETLEAEYTNYTFTIVPADFTVNTNQNGLTVSASDVKQTYDGTGYGVTAQANKAGATILYKDANGEYTLTESPKQTDVGSLTVEFKASLYGYADAYGTATVTIDKRPVTIAAVSAEKTYGEADPSFAPAIMSNQVAGELTDISLAVSRSDAGDDTVGKHEGVLSISATKEALEAEYTNYTFTIVPADFTVTRNEAGLTVSAANVEQTYDGTGYGVNASAGVQGATILYKDANGEYTLTESPKQTDVGSLTVEFKASLYGYADAYGTATVEITKRRVVLTSASKQKKYDGSPLTDHTVTVSGDGFVKGEGASYLVTGSQTYVGTSENVFSYKLYKESTKESNYSIETKYGELEVTDGTSNDPIDAKLVVTKTHTVTKEYELGETVEFTIRVKNIYDTAKTITLKEKDGVSVTPSLFKNVKPGEIVTATAKYTITEQDIKRGSFTNVVNAFFNEAKGFVAEDTVETVPENKSITVHKNVTSTPANGSSYALGETITYEIVAENTGNQTLTNVVVTDPLTNGRWTITSMTPGQKSTVMTTSYVVTEADIQKGSVLNVATATSDENPKPKPGEKEVPTEQQRPSLFITKEADKVSNIQAGDVITYTITVTNNGNVTINDIEVKDELTGDTFNKNVFNLIGSINLAPGESKEFAVRYTATQNDLVNGSIRNVATVTGKDPEGNPVGGDAEKIVNTEKANADYTVTKTVDNPQAEYKVGDVINYTIRVTNTGNLTLNNLTVTDQMQGASGNAVIANKAGVTVNGNTATIATLAVGASIELKASYTVARADADGTLANRVNVTSTTKPGEDPENPNGPTTPSKSGETDPTPTEKTYVLTIHYVDNNGNAVAPDYTARLLAGETIDAVVSPAIDGYTPNFGTIVLPATGMPAANITVTVIYTPDGPDEVLDDPENPNQPNNGGNNGGGNAVNNNNNNANNANNADNGNNAANNNAGQADANPAPADGVIQPDDNGGYDLTPVEDTPTPLANMNLDDHACCILHFLIMLLTLIIFALYTKSRKNRQLKVEELREQLAIASIQKELDLSDEDMAKYLEEAKKLVEEKKQANA